MRYCGNQFFFFSSEIFQVSMYILERSPAGGRESWSPGTIRRPRLQQQGLEDGQEKGERQREVIISVKSKSQVQCREEVASVPQLPAASSRWSGTSRDNYLVNFR